MVCKCNVIEFCGDLIEKNLGRNWNLGPVVVSKEPGSSRFSIFVSVETLDKSLVTVSEFKRAVLSGGVLPFTVKFSVNADRGLYDLGNIEFDDSVVCYYLETHYLGDKMEFVFEMVNRGKELVIFNELQTDNERGDRKPLFWASIRKGDLY